MQPWKDPNPGNRFNQVVLEGRLGDHIEYIEFQAKEGPGINRKWTGKLSIFRPEGGQKVCAPVVLIEAWNEAGEAMTAFAGKAIRVLGELSARYSKAYGLVTFVAPREFQVSEFGDTVTMRLVPAAQAAARREERAETFRKERKELYRRHHENARGKRAAKEVPQDDSFDTPHEW